MSDSGEELFLTQSKFSQEISFDVNSEFEDLINQDDKVVNDFTVSQTFDIGKDFNSDSDQELFEGTQDLLENLATSSLTSSLKGSDQDMSGKNSSPFRFSKPLSENDIKKLCENSRPKNTVNKSTWAVRLFESWVKERKYRDQAGSDWLSVDIIRLAESETLLNRAMKMFIAEVKNQKGQDYRGNTLYEIVGSLQYHIRINGIPVNLFDSPEFTEMRSVLDSRMKELAKMGVGIDKRKAEIITEEEEDHLWSAGVLGEDTAQKLLDTLVYSFGLNFALRAGDEHRLLRIGKNSQLKLLIESNGVKKLKYTEDISKTNRGGLNDRRIERKTVVIGTNEAQPERCVIRLYEKYMSLRPKDFKCTAFYLRPLRYPKHGIWYADQPIGAHPLRSTISRLCQAAGLHGYYTNHSLRATVATRLYSVGVDEQLIAEKTGHRSSALRSYKRTSKAMEERIDNIVQRKLPHLLSETTSSVTSPSQLLSPLSSTSMTSSTTASSSTTTSSGKTKTSSATDSERSLNLVLKDGATLSLSF